MIIAGFCPYASRIFPRGCVNSGKCFYRPQQSWGKVMFLQVCVILFTGGVPDQVPPRPGTPPGTRYTPRTSFTPPGPGTAPRPWRYGLRAGGTHPTGMHSCFFQFFYPKLHDNGRMSTPGGRTSLAPPWICQWLPEFKT